MFNLLAAKYKNDHYREQCLQELRGYKIIREGEDRILNDFIHEIKYIQNQLANTLKRMQKANISNTFLYTKVLLKKIKKR